MLSMIGSRLLKKIKEKEKENELEDVRLQNSYLTYENEFEFKLESSNYFYFKDSYYIGRLNQDCKPEGYGVLIKDKIKYEGMFIDGKLNGIVKILFNGRFTCYFKFVRGQLISQERKRFNNCKTKSGLKSKFCVIM